MLDLPSHSELFKCASWMLITRIGLIAVYIYIILNLPSLPILDPLWTQTVGRLLFEDILVAKLKSKRPPSVTVTEEQQNFEADQENVKLADGLLSNFLCVSPFFQGMMLQKHPQG